MTFGGDSQPTGPIQGIKSFIKNEWQWISIVALIVSVAFGVGVNYANSLTAAQNAASAATAAQKSADAVSASLATHEQMQIAANTNLDTRLGKIEASLNQLIGRLGGPLSMSEVDKDTLKEATVDVCFNAECPLNGN